MGVFIFVFRVTSVLIRVLFILCSLYGTVLLCVKTNNPIREGIQSAKLCQATRKIHTYTGKTCCRKALCAYVPHIFPPRIFIRGKTKRNNRIKPLLKEFDTQRQIKLFHRCGRIKQNRLLCVYTHTDFLRYLFKTYVRIFHNHSPLRCKTAPARLSRTASGCSAKTAKTISENTSCTNG